MSGYVVDIDDQSIEVRIEHENGQNWAIVNGNRYLVDLQSAGENGRYSISIDGRKSPIIFTGNGRGHTLFARGRSYDVLVERTAVRELRKHLKSSGLGGSDAGVVESHMPGLIVKVNIKPGEVVTEGQSLLVIEAMKMENEIRAPITGVVESIDVEPGSEVAGGQTLCILRPEDLNE